MDANALHISYEGGGLEDPWWCPPDDIWRLTVNPEDAPNEAEIITIAFERGDAVAVNGQAMTPYGVLDALNQLAGKHGIGRLDIVENRYVGIKSRGCYETPGGTILLKAHRAIESLCLDREQAHLKDEMMPRYAKLIYNGYWFSPERRALQALIDDTQVKVNGEVRLKLLKGNVYNAGRRSRDSLFDATLSTFEDDRGAYNQKDAEGFIRLNGLRLRTGAKRDQR
jgi:argininosuccinate synthase